MKAKHPHVPSICDVYYSGLNSEEHVFLPTWPEGSDGTDTLNSNHEMYCGGAGYFGTLLGNPLFNAQQGLSHFALTNDHWLMPIRLDSAYFGYYQSLLYEEGSICEPNPARSRTGWRRSHGFAISSNSTPASVSSC